jgi:hypothetical protein
MYVSLAFCCHQKRIETELRSDSNGATERQRSAMNRKKVKDQKEGAASDKYKANTALIAGCIAGSLNYEYEWRMVNISYGVISRTCHVSRVFIMHCTL